MKWNTVNPVTTGPQTSGFNINEMVSKWWANLQGGPEAGFHVLYNRYPYWPVGKRGSLIDG